MQIEEVEKVAKDILVSRGKHTKQLMFEMPDGEFLPMILAVDEEEENKLMETFRLFVKVMNVKRYFFISEVWASKNVFGRPRDDKDRTEALIISEFRSDNNNRNIMNHFGRGEDNDIIFTDRFDDIDKNLQSYSKYNFYLEDFDKDGEFKKRLMKDKSLDNIDFVLDEMKEKLGPMFDMLKAKGITEDGLRKAMTNMIKKDKLLIDKDKRAVYMNEPGEENEEKNI